MPAVFAFGQIDDRRDTLRPRRVFLSVPGSYPIVAEAVGAAKAHSLAHYAGTGAAAFRVHEATDRRSAQVEAEGVPAGCPGCYRVVGTDRPPRRLVGNGGPVVQLVDNLLVNPSSNFRRARWRILWMYSGVVPRISTTLASPTRAAGVCVSRHFAAIRCACP